MESLASHPDIEALAGQEAPLEVVIRTVPLHSATPATWVEAALAQHKDRSAGGREGPNFQIGLIAFDSRWSLTRGARAGRRAGP